MATSAQLPHPDIPASLGCGQFDAEFGRCDQGLVGTRYNDLIAPASFRLEKRLVGKSNHLVEVSGLVR